MLKGILSACLCFTLVASFNGNILYSFKFRANLNYSQSSAWRLAALNASFRIEFGGGVVGKVNVDFFSGPAPSVTFNDPSTKHHTEKQHYGESRSERWFG